MSARLITSVLVGLQPLIVIFLSGNEISRSELLAVSYVIAIFIGFLTYTCPGWSKNQ